MKVATPMISASVSCPASHPLILLEMRVIVARRCAPCHSAVPTFPGFMGAPKGLILDTPDEIRTQRERILTAAVTTRIMPPVNVTGMTEEEREQLGHWIRAGGLK